MERPGLGFWLKWVATCITFGLSLAIIAGFAGHVGLCYSAAGGIALGALQGIVLRKYIGSGYALQWTFATAVGWLGGVPVVLFTDFIAGAGGGLNPETDVRGCELIGCVVAAIFFSSVQRIQSPLFEPFSWVMTNAVAWGIGAFFGGAVGFLVYDALNPTVYVELDEPWGKASIASGILVGITIYAIISGLSALFQLRLARSSGYLTAGESSRIPTRSEYDG